MKHLKINPIQKRHLHDLAQLASESSALDFNQCLHQIQKEYNIICNEVNSKKKTLMIFVACVNDRCIAYARVQYHIQIKDEPTAWYLMGVVVHSSYRRMGIGLALTKQRMDWINSLQELYCFINSNNQASIQLHKKCSFELKNSDFSFPRVSFVDGQGLLFQYVKKV
ncbi:GNAT family N-acetyltransferase [bacterium]|nr:GNAT family N-acetyltransferase [bacterium]